MIENLGPVFPLLITLFLIIWSFLLLILPFIIMGMHSRLKEIDSQLVRIVALMEGMERSKRPGKSAFSAGER